MRSKGQTFLPDFLASIAIFGAITAVFLFSWNSVISNQGEFSQSQNMRTEARYTTTFMVSTAGYPEDWNASTVEIPGFASGDNLLQHEKIQEFGKLDYEAQKRLLTVENFLLEFRENGTTIGGGESIGDEPVAYMVESSSSFSDVKTLHVLNESNTTWDLYWPSGSNQDELEGLTARNVYNYTEDGTLMMDDLIGNASGSYPTIIAEDVNIDSSEISNNEELENYVETGGSFVHTESDPNLITNTFDLNNSGDDSESAVIEKVDPLLNSSLEAGDTVEFDDLNAAYDTPDVVYANGTESDAGCVACEWSIGSGSLFYISDTFSDTDNVGLAFEDADESIGRDYRFGVKPGETAQTVTPVTRDVLLETEGGVRDVEMVYTVWR